MWKNTFRKTPARIWPRRRKLDPNERFAPHCGKDIATDIENNPFDRDGKLMTFSVGYQREVLIVNHGKKHAFDTWGRIPPATAGSADGK